MTPNDLAAFYFGAPLQQVVGFGRVSDGPETETGEFDWTERTTATFCSFSPVLVLQKPFRLDEVSGAAFYRNWLSGSPYRNTKVLPERIGQAFLKQLTISNRKIAARLLGRVASSKRSSTEALNGDDGDWALREGVARELVAEMRFRDPRVKGRAIEERGALCEVCGFDFGKTYGDLGCGFIEVHHDPALSRRRGHGMTRRRDVTLVCANCHRMLHASGSEPMPVANLRQLVRQRTRQDRRDRALTSPPAGRRG